MSDPRFAGLPVPDHLVHGPNSWARRQYRCECAVCLPSGRPRPTVGVGQTERTRRLRESKMGKPVPPHVKHGSYAYKVYGCRCEACIGDNRKRWKPRNVPRATVNDVDVVHWPPVGDGWWTCPNCGQTFPMRDEAA